MLAQAGKMFVFIAQALEGDSIQGQTANRVVAAAKALMSTAAVDPAPLLQQHFSPASQQKVAAYFS